MSPAGHELPASLALPPAQAGALHDYAERVTSRLGPNESAFWLVDRADFSLDTRLALVDSAVTSLDIQYFIWEKDASAWLFARRVISAADRGVRVRIVLDDLSVSAHEKEFASLGSNVQPFRESHNSRPGSRVHFQIRPLESSDAQQVGYRGRPLRDSRWTQYRRPLLRGLR
jgi:phosphatidylserine/phosphatidylglycerophosphate/cardiolipin synthase-like enzyme